MGHHEMLSGLHLLSEVELRSLNHAVCDQLKRIRNSDAARKRHLLKSGDKVSWSGRRGYTEGIIVRVKRKKAIVNTGEFSNWDVPLNMLTAVEK